MIKAKLGSYIDGWIHKAFPFLFKRAVNPNLLTVLGTLICVGAAAAFAAGEFAWGALLLLAGGFFDLVDGVVARHFQSSTAFGAFLDSTMDRLVDMVVMLGIMLHYGSSAQPGVAMLAGLVLISSVLTSYAKARAELFVTELRGGFFERGERVGLLAAGGVFDVMIPVLWVLAIGTTVTVIQRFAAAHREMADAPLTPPTSAVEHP